MQIVLSALMSVMLFFCISCNTGKEKVNSDTGQVIIKPDTTVPNSLSTPLQEVNNSAVEYEIIREPNGGSGVFDFMYIVYVKENVTKEQAKWLFNDIIKRKGNGKIAIDVWSSKKAFSEELKIYQKEDEVYDNGGDLKAFAKERDKVTAKYDKYNVAQYANNGVDITVRYPDE